ncbi:MAG: tRNA (guanine(10)-N(2))-dimethyltransferase [Candidatus Micrarchaeia archaeon]
MQVAEGLANIEVTPGTFYNPKMKRLRDISVCFLNAAAKPGFSALDCTAATGIRGIRYALEANAGHIVLVEINSEAYKVMSANVKANKIEDKAKTVNASIQSFANSAKEKFDAIDLDPFGTPAPYVFDLMKLAKDGTLLMVTATDTATLCGAEGDACLRIYAAKPVRNELCHEASIRILLAFVAKIAAQFDFGIEPLLSLAELHYIRLFIRLKRSARAAVESIESIGSASSCSTCHAFYYSKGIGCAEQVCKFCGSKTVPFGPLWLGSLYDKQVIGKMLELSTDKAITSTLSRILDEYDTPFFYSLDKISEYLHLGSVARSSVISLLLKDGKAKASATQFGRNAIKTNADISLVMNTVKEASKK